MSALARLTLSIAASIAAFVTPAAMVSAQNLPLAGKAVDSCPTEGGCQVEGGFYRVMLPPPTAAGRRPGAIMFFHGWQGSADETMSDQGLVDVARRLGVALIAPDGMGKTWSYPGSPGHHRDEFAFVAQVLDDVVRRFAVDPDAMMASGFSQGASMVWNLACRMPTRFHAFAPIAGAFWEPLPADCAEPRPNLVHFHGTSDPTVPLAGRSLRQGYKQGDVFKSLAILAPGCTASWAADVRSAEPPATLSCRAASGCSGPARLELCLHPGGHYADPTWVERAWRVAMPTGAPVAATGAKLTFP
ncbi:alpha/beta hydrolase family esterase [Bosea lathyri]|uniref:Polyhydroxybutyrate depolymerase n=1 Tax=Bosea lathyri TaxID=1036778 RepID=A0A1H5Z0X1_9HYPH|nr:PHB depolymerase family esterase [Bosea lathyri]SEG29690.1 polyhydroxybutyrate depolymerase [Bosea lathyri]